MSPGCRSLVIRKAIAFFPLAIAILAALLAFAQPVAAGGERIPVAASILPQAYFVERLGGRRVDVKVMIPKGVSPEIYEPTAQQLIAFSRARMYVKVGGAETFPAERKYGRLMAESRAPVEVVGFAEKNSLIKDDPHIWLSPAAVKELCREISQALIRLDPTSKSYFTAHYNAFLQDIDRAEREIRKTLAGREGQSFLVYHPGWGHFAAAFGLNQLAIEEEGKAANAAHIKRIVELAKKKGIDTIFVQKGFDTRSARSVAREIKGTLVEVDNLEKDWLNNLINFARLLKGALK